MISVGGLKSALQKFKTNKVDGKADKTATVSTVGYNTTSKKITKTINGTTSDVVSASTIVTDGGGIKDISGKADKATTLSGYGITDAYTKTEIDTKIGNIETLLAAI